MPALSPDIWGLSAAELKFCSSAALLATWLNHYTDSLDCRVLWTSTQNLHDHLKQRKSGFHCPPKTHLVLLFAGSQLHLRPRNAPPAGSGTPALYWSPPGCSRHLCHQNTAFLHTENTACLAFYLLYGVKEVSDFPQTAAWKHCSWYRDSDLLVKGTEFSLQERHKVLKLLCQFILGE